MQFKITLRCLEMHPVLPINYQYALSAWIYKVIQHADAEYASFLHQRGHITGRKTFKLFCFSNLRIPRFHLEGDRLHILSPEISLLVGFYLDRTAEEFVKGLFSEQQFTLGDRKSRALFVVQTVEMRTLTLPERPEPVRIHLLSPLVIARKSPERDAPDQYLAPDDPDFSHLLFLNLQEKYTAATQLPVPEWWDSSRFSFQPIGAPPRSKLITIKPDVDAQTRVRGWLFDFEMHAPRELIETGLLAGFGRMNGEGFGCGEVAAERLERNNHNEKTRTRS